MTSGKIDGVSNHRQLDCLFNYIQANILKVNVPLYFPFVQGIHQWPKDSAHKTSVMREAFPCR